LVVARELDRIVNLERLKSEVLRTIKGAELVIVEGLGHLLPVEAPMEVSRIAKEFWSLKS